jgi:REP element-mobilizing transposase RayT
MDRLIPIVSDERYHVYSRGNDRHTLFHDVADYRAFQAKMEQLCSKHNVERVAYVLMPNHFHTILIQRPGGDLPRMMDALGTSYAKRYNLRHNHTGHVFEGRYRYAHIPSEEALLNVARYVHLNPVRAGLVARPEDWEFSDFLEIRTQGVLHRGLIKAEGRLEHGIDYVAFVHEGVKDIESLRRLLFEAEVKAAQTKASFNNDQA